MVRLIQIQLFFFGVLYSQRFAYANLFKRNMSFIPFSHMSVSTLTCSLDRVCFWLDFCFCFCVLFFQNLFCMLLLLVVVCLNLFLASFFLFDIYDSFTLFSNKLHSLSRIQQFFFFFFKQELLRVFVFCIDLFVSCLLCVCFILSFRRILIESQMHAVFIRG